MSSHYSSNNRAVMMGGTNARRSTSNNDTTTTMTSVTADDSTNFTTGDESSILLRPTATNTPSSAMGGNIRNTIGGIDKKNSEGSGYHFGNSSVGGSSSVLRPGISYNPTVNTNYNTTSGSVIYGAGNGGLGSSRRSMMMTMHNNNDGTNSRTSQSMNNNGHRLYFGNFCGLCSVYDLHSEVLEYNYAVEAAEVKAAAAAVAAGGTNNNAVDALGKPISTPTSGGTIGTNTPAGSSRRQPLPRIRTRGEYYIDTFNDETWSWTMGTNEAVSEF
jgi:hypothetical protein